ncbi:DUF2829 domain-containing protein [Vaginisenegalia massiliensis]|uniref:DUF2829 domain-containing protein n=1 Tax=Vaginisenegalia massiliensis TaxID=2058294 RepID=UPI000F54BE86|nr:DUF2829 domain-containing protein [Vaginisenegalia massiliensis]
MSFEEILPELKAGKKVIRQGWHGLEEYVCLMDPKELEGQTMNPYFVIMVKGEGYTMFTPTVCDILANDWKVVA